MGNLTEKKKLINKRDKVLSRGNKKLPQFPKTIAGLEESSSEWNFKKAAHLLRRTTIGPTYSEITESVKDGLDKTLNKLLDDTQKTFNPPLNFLDEEDPETPLGETWVNAERKKNDSKRENSYAAWRVSLILDKNEPNVLLPHRPNYFLPLTWQARPSNDELERAINQYADENVPLEEGYDHLEAIVQLSLKYIIAEDVLGNFSRIELGYTNRSFWQVYNSDISRPFRETNHEPELMVSWMLKDKIVDYVRLSLNHQSNGQTSTLSRSWNRIIAETAFIVGSGVISPKVWWRIPEGKEADPADPKDNDNPDIDDYLGYGELNYVKLMQKHQFSIMVRNNLDFSENRGAVELGYSFPLTKKIKGYAQYFNGYGESLIDYDRYQERFGIGIKLTDWF